MTIPMFVSGVYKIECLVNRNVYIGYSGNVYVRLNGHKQKLRNKKIRYCNRNLLKDFLAYGEENFTFEVLEVFPDKESACRAEFYYGKKFKENHNLYNLKGFNFYARQAYEKSLKS